MTSILLAPPSLFQRSEVRSGRENIIRLISAKLLIKEVYHRRLNKINDYHTLGNLLEILSSAKELLDDLDFSTILYLEAEELAEKKQILMTRIKAREDMIYARIKWLDKNRSEVRLLTEIQSHQRIIQSS